MLTCLLVASAQISPGVAARLPERESGDEILITASLFPVVASESPVSATVFDESTIKSLGFSTASDLLRLAPGVAVAASGARGTETVVRIRGAESNHTLIFVDGVAFNDIAAANAARFDALSSGGLGRIELIRGPQSALWGSEALGGVVSLSSPDPLGPLRAELLLEGGTDDFRRAEAIFASGGDQAGLTATATWQGSEGIDILGMGFGDTDGFETLTAGLKGIVRSGAFETGAVVRFTHHNIEFDGFDPLTFRRADTLDVSVAATWAARAWLGYDDGSRWSARLEAQHLDSENRNRVGALRTADSRGSRLRFGGRLGRHVEVGVSRHDLLVALEREEEEFETRDRTNSLERRVDRARTAYVGEWRARWSGRLTTDLAVRHDDFNRFADDTSLRFNLVWDMAGGLQILAGYGEGIAQPGFTDLFGFPGFGFVGNPDLRPETSRGFEAGLRWRSPAVILAGIVFSNDLEGEIVEDFATFPATVINAEGKSRRRGVELAVTWRPNPSIRLDLNYTFLDARGGIASEADVKEIRRPRHTANAFLDWRSGPFSAAASLAYVGGRSDRDFDLFPAPLVRLGAYWLSSLRAGYRLLPQLEAFARVENAFDSDYQDVLGYNMPGRKVHAGLRLALGH